MNPIQAIHYDFTATHIKLTGVANDLVRQAWEALKELYKKLIGEISTIKLSSDTVKNLPLLKGLFARTEPLISDAYWQISAMVGTSLAEISVRLARRYRDITNQHLHAKVATLGGITQAKTRDWLNDAMIVTGKTHLDVWSRLVGNANDSFKTKVRAAVGSGEDNVADVVAKLFQKPPKRGRPRRNLMFDLQTDLRSSVYGVGSDTAERWFRGNQQIINGWQWLSTLDFRTTPICVPRDKKWYDLDNNPVGHSREFLGGPGKAHRNCRSIRVPGIRPNSSALDRIPKGVRASLGDTSPFETNYEKWLRGRPEKEQREKLRVMLGEGYANSIWPRFRRGEGFDSLIKGERFLMPVGLL